MTDKNTRQHLQAERERLEKRLEAIRADFRRGLDADSEERATELENADTLVEIARVTEEQLERVKASLNALDK